MRAECAEAQNRTCFVLEFFIRYCYMTRHEEAKVLQMVSQDRIECAASSVKASKGKGWVGRD